MTTHSRIALTFPFYLEKNKKDIDLALYYGMKHSFYNPYIQKHKDNFVFQIKSRIFANGNCRSGAKQCAPLDIVIIRYVNIWRYDNNDFTD